MNKQLKSLLMCILDEEFGPDPDDSASRNRLVQVLTQALTPDDYSEVVTIAEAIFPDARVDETMDSCEVVISTGLYNVAAGGEEPHLIESRGANSREIFPDPDTLYCIYGDSDG
jgi:hypothetical protein